MRRFVLSFIFLFSSLSYAGNNAVAALELGVGARALGMGGAYVALSDDVYGHYWNPSGLAFVNTYQAGSMHAQLFNSFAQQNYLSVAVPLFGGVTIGGSWLRVSVDDIKRYQAPDDDRLPGDQLKFPSTGTFSDANDIFVLSFAKYQRVILDLGWQYFEFPIDIGYGANIKMINEALDNKTGSGIGLDLGFILKLELRHIFDDKNFGDLIWGVSGQDIAETTITWDTASKRKDKVERNFKYGLAYKQPLDFIDSQFTLSFDLNSRYAGSTHFGTEFLYNSLLAVRVGLNDGDFTTGAGVYVWNFKVDYALQTHEALGKLHRVSLLFQL